MARDTGHGKRKCGKEGCGRGNKIHTDCPKGIKKAIENDITTEMLKDFRANNQPMQAVANNPYQTTTIQGTAGVPFVRSDRYMTRNQYADTGAERFMEKHKEIFNDIEYGEFDPPKKIRVLGGEELTVYPLNMFGFEVAYYERPDHQRCYNIVVNLEEELKLKEFLKSGSGDHLKNFKKLNIDEQVKLATKMFKNIGVFQYEKWTRLIGSSGKEVEILQKGSEIDQECRKKFSASSAYVYLALAEEYGFKLKDKKLEKFRKAFPNDMDVQRITLGSVKNMAATILSMIDEQKK